MRQAEEILIRRICALYAEELISARIVERELSEQASAPTEVPTASVTLSTRCGEAAHWRPYFADQPDESAAGQARLTVYWRIVERTMIELTLAATRGNQVRAAEVLGPSTRNVAPENPGAWRLYDARDDADALSAT